ncbi:MAG TPA: SPOR domain-containing protein [Candidatus Acidoferrales bacterium]|nr:SPOR domain-containing protein [Candidatus Acidoferrales bacterium]
MRRLGSAGLTYTQVFLLVIGFGVASGLIFLFGMWVGRDLAERRLAQEERIVRQPVPALPTQPPEEVKEQDVDRAFYERLKDKAVERLQEASKVGSPSVTPFAIGQVATAVPLAATTTPHATSRPTAVPTIRTVTVQSPKPTPTARVHPTPAAEGSANEWADAGWTVQINATTDPEQARGLAARLRSKGYDAYTVQAPARGQVTWYRVRVGRFKSRDRAVEMEERLKSEEKLEDSFVTPQ